MEWIKVEDKMPEFDVDVLFYDTEFENIELGSYTGVQWRTVWANVDVWFIGVTHWMPLPDRPGGE